MSNPYSSVTVSGYNATPPADDGSAVTANQVAWQKHLDKIGAPLKTAIESINTNALAALGKVFGAGIITKAAPYTITSSDIGKVVSVTATTTITLLAATTAGDGFPLLIANHGTGVVTVDGNASETINGSPTITLNPGDFIVLTCNGTTWFGGVSQFKDAEVIKVKTGDTSVSSADTGTTLTDDPILVGFPILSQQRYAVSGFLRGTQNVGKFKCAFAFDNAALSGGFVANAVDTVPAQDYSAVATPTGVMSFSIIGNTNGFLIDLKGHVEGHASLDALMDFQWAQNVSSANVTTLFDGCWIKVRQIGS